MIRAKKGDFTVISKKHYVLKILGLRELPAAGGEKNHFLAYKYFKFPFLKATNSFFFCACGELCAPTSSVWLVLAVMKSDLMWANLKNLIRKLYLIPVT